MGDQSLKKQTLEEIGATADELMRIDDAIGECEKSLSDLRRARSLVLEREKLRNTIAKLDAAISEMLPPDESSRRRTWGSGSVYRRMGRWWIRWRDNGKRHGVSFLTEADALAGMEEINRHRAKQKIESVKQGKCAEPIGIVHSAGSLVATKEQPSLQPTPPAAPAATAPVPIPPPIVAPKIVPPTPPGPAAAAKQLDDDVDEESDDECEGRPGEPKAASTDALRAEISRQQAGGRGHVELLTTRKRDHIHVAKVDRFGDGQTKADKTGHAHRVSSFLIANAQGHSHDLTVRRP
jgi:hypothetical protein